MSIYRCMQATRLGPADAYVSLKVVRDSDGMFDIAPDHSIGLYAGLLALPLALLAIRLRPARRRVAGTTLAASVLMVVAGAIHLGLISTHRSEPLTARGGCPVLR